jgi:phospholipid/cholesterol/gamma-HCH transport system substrate-binding protein
VISGVKVGQVSDIRLDPDLRAQVTLELDGRLELPVDTSAKIRTSGLLGDQFIALVPGAEEEMLASGDALSFTENALNIESLVGRMVHSFEQGEEK